MTPRCVIRDSDIRAFPVIERNLERLRGSVTGELMRRDQLEHAIRTACQIIGRHQAMTLHLTGRSELSEPQI
jgi:hypothetical protein